MSAPFRRRHHWLCLRVEGSPCGEPAYRGNLKGSCARGELAEVSKERLQQRWPQRAGRGRQTLTVRTDWACPQFSSVLRPMPMYSFSRAWVSFVIFCLGTFWANFCKHFSFPVCMPNVPHIPSFLIRSSITLCGFLCSAVRVRRPTAKFLPLTLFSDLLWLFSDFLDPVLRLAKYKLKVHIVIFPLKSLKKYLIIWKQLYPGMWRRVEWYICTGFWVTTRRHIPAGTVVFTVTALSPPPQSHLVLIPTSAIWSPPINTHLSRVFDIFLIVSRV